jgi:hypothetical protein
MSIPSLTCLILFILAGFIVLPGLAAVITFEEGIPVPRTVQSQYCNDPATNVGVKFLEEDRIFEPGVQTASGIHALTNDYGQEFGEFKKITIQFTTEQKAVSVRVGLDRQHSSSITAFLRAYSSPIPGGNPAGQTSVGLGTGPTPITQELSISTSSSVIRSIEIEFINEKNVGAYEVIDDLSFDSAGPPCFTDSTAPTVHISAPTDGKVIQSPYTVELAYTATDTGTGIARIQVAALGGGKILKSFDACGGPNTQPCVYTVVPTTVSSDYITSIPPDAQYLRVTAWDFAGNSGEDATSFTVVPVGFPNLWIEGLEITQATQTWVPMNIERRKNTIPTFKYPSPPEDLSVPLVAKRTTFVRVYPAVEGTLNNIPVNGIKAELRCFLDSGYSKPCPGLPRIESQKQPGIGKVITVHPDKMLTDRQRNTKLSWNFLLPEAWTALGTIYLQAKAMMPPGMAECTGCEDGANAMRISDIPFTEVPDFDALVHVILVTRVLDYTPPPENEEPIFLYLRPDGAQVDQSLTDTAGMIPIDDTKVINDLTEGAFFDYSSRSGMDRCDALLDWVCKQPKGKWKAVYAYVDDQFDCFNSRIGGLARVGEGCAWGQGSSIAHETGHALGFVHAGPPPGHRSECQGDGSCDIDWPWPHGTIGYFGFNTRTMIPIPWDFDVEATSAHDFMSYGGNRWVSPRTWVRMFDSFTGNSFPVPGVRSASMNLPIRGSSTSHYLIMSGKQQDDGSWVLDPAYEMILPSGTSGQAGTGDYRIVLLDSAGKELGSQDFSIPSNRIDMQDPATGTMDALPVPPSFVHVIQLPADVMTVEFRASGEVLASLTRSMHVPSVEIVSPAGSGLGNPTQIKWMATDPDGDSLRYMVQYSPDPRQDDWQTLAVDLEANEIPVDPAHLPGSTDARVRVLATDGLNTGSAISLPFSVEDKPPKASILSPVPGTTIERRERLVLMGSGSDLEDGSLEGSALAWSSDRDGALGTGNRLDITLLTLGEHRITLTAQDSHGLRDTASITVNVVTPVNHQPVAEAGSDRTTIVGTPVHLDGTGSFDEDGDPLSYSWFITDAPGTGHPSITGAATAQPIFSADTVGDYTIDLMVDDGMVASVSDQVHVQVTGGKPGIAIMKNPSATTIMAGGTVTYTYEITNAGDVALSGITVTDDKTSPVYMGGDTNANGKLDLGEKWIYTATAKPAGTITNTATVTGTDLLARVVSASARATVVVNIRVFVDIEPGFCPNLIGLNLWGKLNLPLPIAIVGTKDFDVNKIDPGSIRLSRDGVGGTVQPKWNKIMDVATPYTGTKVCGCNPRHIDSIKDFVLVFDSGDMIKTLKLDKDVVGKTLSFTITGNLKPAFGGTPIHGSDCIKVLSLCKDHIDVF